MKIGIDIDGVLTNDDDYILDTATKFCLENKTDVAIFCVPKTATPAIAERLYSLGIKNYWNFSHYDLTVKFPDVKVENVHFGDSLMTLSYRIDCNKKPKNEE